MAAKVEDPLNSRYPGLDRYTRRHWRTRERDVQIAMAYADLSQHWTAKQLAELYGISQQTVYETIWEYAPRAAAARHRSGARRIWDSEQRTGATL